MNAPARYPSPRVSRRARVAPARSMWLAGAWLTLGVGVLAAPRPAVATEDGGTVSMFAHEAGNRGLALGGAYAAIADDASGWMWNPAGLGRIGRSEFQVTQASYGELGSRELYAGYAHPSWRWGALAASYRQFGVDGIEARDDRNVLLPGELTDRESEFAFGYGRELGRGWSAGAVAKFRRQELAGRSANALGADLGLIVDPARALGADDAWWRDLTLAVSLRNALRPGLRLDAEEVPDPRGARLGMAWRHAAWGIPALGALDVETTDGRSARLHAGLQISAHPTLDLRVGMSGGHLTAGTGLRIRGLMLDYAFEDGPVTAAHRVGVSFPFGLTTGESRALAQRQREDELQERLSRAFEEQQRTRIEDLVARAEEAQRAGDCDAALERVAALKAIAPEDPRPSALEARCLQAQARASEAQGDLAGAAVLYGRALALAPADTAASAGLQRCRAGSDLRAARSADLRRRFAAALDAFTNDDLATARRGLRGILKDSPGDAEAGAMLRRVDRAAERRLGALLEQAERRIAAGLLDDAARLVAEARALEPGDSEVARLASELERAQGQLAARPRTDIERNRPGADAPTPLTAQDRRDLQALYERGLVALQQSHTEEAIRYFELVWAKDHSHARVSEYLKREYLTRGLEAFANGRLREAVAVWEQALRVDPSDERTRAYLARAQEHLARTSAIGSR